MFALLVAQSPRPHDARSLGSRADAELTTITHGDGIASQLVERIRRFASEGYSKRGFATAAAWR